MIFILNVIFTYMILLVHPLAFSRLYYFISITVTRYGVIIINSRAITTRGIIFIRCLGTDIIDLIKFTTWTRALGHAKEHIIMFIGSLQFPYTIIFGFAALLPRIPPTPSLTDSCSYLFFKAMFWAIQFIRALGHSGLILQHEVTLGTFILGGFITLIIAVR